MPSSANTPFRQSDNGRLAGQVEDYRLLRSDHRNNGRLARRDKRRVSTFGNLAGISICVAITGCFLVIGAAMDRNEARRPQAEQPPEPPYSRTIDL